MKKKAVFLFLSLCFFYTNCAKAADIKISSNAKFVNRTDSRAVSYALIALSQDFQRKLGSPAKTKPALDFQFQIDSNWNDFDQYKIIGWHKNDQNARTGHIEALLSNYLDHVKDLKFFNLDYKSRNSKTPGLQYKYQPFWESEYRDEIKYMEDADYK